MNRKCDPRITCGNSILSTAKCIEEAPSMRTIKVTLLSNKVHYIVVHIFSVLWNYLSCMAIFRIFLMVICPQCISDIIQYSDGIIE